MTKKSSRRKPAREAFEGKLRILEDAAHIGRLPEFVPTIRNLQDFQNWQDPDRGLSAWANTSVLNRRGPNADLRARLDHVWYTLGPIPGTIERPVANRRSATEKVLEQKIASLNLQVCKLIVERDEILRESRMMLARYESLEGEHGRTKGQLAQMIEQQDKVITLVPKG